MKRKNQEKEIIMNNRENKPVEKPIYEYIRRRYKGKFQKIGVIYGNVHAGVIRVGWSKCNLKSGDKFNPHTGLEMAEKRTIQPDRTNPPLCIRRQLRRFGARCIRYFQQADKLELN
jgi:hypothetical protein